MASQRGSFPVTQQTTRSERTERDIILLRVFRTRTLLNTDACTHQLRKGRKTQCLGNVRVSKISTEPKVDQIITAVNVGCTFVYLLLLLKHISIISLLGPGQSKYTLDRAVNPPTPRAGSLLPQLPTGLTVEFYALTSIQSLSS